MPLRHVILDTEGRRERTSSGEIQTWRCAVIACLTAQQNGSWTRVVTKHRDALSLWLCVTAFTRAKRRTVLWAHNLSYDMRISGMFTYLPALGWQVRDLRLGPGGAWICWTSGGRTLTCVDSTSVWPVPLATLATSMGMAKLAAPAADDNAGWLRRCDADVRILGRVVTEYVDWLRREDMGCWQMTGAGQAWAHWRHRHYTHRVLAGDPCGAAEIERRALWTGRAEAWRWGSYPTATVYDYDWECAYANIAATTDVPVAQQGSLSRCLLSQALVLAETRGVLAHVTVRTALPLVPCEVNGRIVWPVGEFRTVLWDPELTLLARHNAGVDIHRGWLYRREPALASWGAWILEQLSRPDGDIPGWQKVALKHWSRALIGRFAMRYRTWERFATSPDEVVEVTDGVFHGSGAPLVLLQVGRDVFAQSVERDSDNGAPMITGYVQSLARVQLWDAIQAVGEQHVYHVATDSMLLSTAGARAAERAIAAGNLVGLRSKGRYRGVEIGGPNQTVVGGRPRIAGLSARAVRTGDATWATEVWQGAAESLRRGSPDSVTITDRTFRARARDDRRARLPDGRTRPLRVRVDPSGRNVLDEG